MPLVTARPRVPGPQGPAAPHAWAPARPPAIDARERRRQKLRNTLQSLTLLGAMAGALTLVAAAWFGPLGVAWTVLLTVSVLVTGPPSPSRRLLARHGARPLPPWLAPGLHRTVHELAGRAGLPATPELHLVHSPAMNAFATGHRDAAALAVTDGLLRGLDRRELVGVLAHEISHIRAGDLWIVHLSAAVGRALVAAAQAGAVLVVLAVGSGDPAISPLLLLALTTAPTTVTLLQLALSRAREYDADLDAATLTGDPVGLASALERLERAEGGTWERVARSARHGPDPLLRTHPPTADRVRRLLALRGPRTIAHRWHDADQSHTRSSRHASPRRTSS